jgi:hypothetical protein
MRTIPELQMKNVESFALHICLIFLGMAGAANAATFTSTYYGLTATSLGGSYSLTSDATGYVTAVTSADGNQTYRFDKYPVTHDWVQIRPGPDPATRNDSVYEVMHNKYGTVDVTHYEYGTYGSIGAEGVPGVTAYGGMPMSYPGLKNPVNDFNIHGVVVGTNGGDAAATTNFGYLQNDFPSIPGLIFDSALLVDDSGQVIASGTLDGRPMDFLVTQGQPAPVPEPSTLMILGCALAVIGLRSVRVGSRQ